MSLYTPRQFVAPPASATRDVLALIRDRPFATLITVSAGGGEPHVTHLPLLLLDGDAGPLTGHLARANPHWQAFADGHTTAVFHGPHAYVSPRWYVEPAREVPTWNYAAVLVHGRPELVEVRDAKLAVVDASAAAFEPTENPWTRAVDGPRLEALLAGVVAFRLPLARVEAKFKMSQNKTQADRARVAAALRAEQHPDLAAMADWMQRHEPA